LSTEFLILRRFAQVFLFLKERIGDFYENQRKNDLKQGDRARIRQNEVKILFIFVNIY